MGKIIIINGKKYERVKSTGRENCNDCDLSKTVKYFGAVPVCWEKSNEKILKYCENHINVLYKEVQQ